MIYIVGSVIIALITLWNLKKGFLLYLLYELIWFPDTQVIQVGSSSLNINFLMASFYIAIFFIKCKGRIRRKGNKFPYTTPMLCLPYVEIYQRG